ncbi:MAG: hypothetical protein PUE13_01735 [Clostridiales bacterium]|nr:hypothetical protein [Clostridiales bacterium]
MSSNSDKYNKQSFLNHIYVLRRDFKDVQTGMYCTDSNHSENEGISRKTSN